MKLNKVKLNKGCYAAICACAFGMTATAQAGFVNGGFETDPFGGGFVPNVQTLPVTGWSFNVPPGESPHPEGRGNIGGSGPTPFGNQWVVLGGFGTGGVSIMQTLAGLIPGDFYKVNFAISSEDAAAGANVLVSATGSPGSAFTAPAAVGGQWNVWGNNSYTFQASAAIVTVSFLDTGSTAFNDIGLDNVSLSAVAVPEPGTALFGLALFGATLTRRRRLIAS